MLAGLELVAELLAFLEPGHAGALDGADVDEGVLAAFLVGDEAVAAVVIEEFTVPVAMIGPFMQKCPRANGAAGPVKLERKKRGPKASGSLAGDVSEAHIGASRRNCNAAFGMAAAGWRGPAIRARPPAMLVQSFLALLLAMQTPGSALERFFVGRTEGSGTVHVMMSGRHAVRDRATGRMQRRHAGARSGR